jgi:hypothetical protein
MCDLITLFHLPVASQYFVRRSAALVERVANKVGLTDPATAQNLRAMTGVLTGWWPLFAGVGMFRLTREDGANVEMHFGDHERPLVATVQPKFHFTTKPTINTALELRTKGRQVSCSMGGVNLAINLLESLYRRSGPFTDYGTAEAIWEWDDCPSPAPEWETLRKEVARTHANPPRAVHWMAPSIRWESGVPDGFYNDN